MSLFYVLSIFAFLKVASCGFYLLPEESFKYFHICDNDSRCNARQSLFGPSFMDPYVVKTASLYLLPEALRTGCSSELVLEYFDDAPSNTYLPSFPSNDMDSDGQMWFALVQRGECSFTQKVRAMQELGASGVFIFNNQSPQIGPDELVLMSAPPQAETNDIMISSFSISFKTYCRLWMGMNGFKHAFDRNLMFRLVNGPAGRSANEIKSTPSQDPRSLFRDLHVCDRPECTAKLSAFGPNLADEDTLCLHAL